MMVLADTNIWIAHMQRGEKQLERLLEQGRVLIHPFVIGELACGTFKNRQGVLALLQSLSHARSATHDEVMFYVERHALMGRGLGYVDAHLLASVALESGAKLYTRDGRLYGIAVERGCAFLT